MTKIKIKCETPNIATRSAILQIISNYGARCSKLVVPSDNKCEFLAYCNSDSDADKVLCQDSIDALSGINCVPVLPLHIKAKRTVIVKRLDQSISENSEADILDELDKQNDFLTVVDLFKFPNSNIIKITCRNQEMANKCVDTGLKMFHFFVSPTDVALEEYFDVRLCYKCYALDSHLTHQCPEQNDYVICSNCSQLGHNFRSCESTVKTCINCAGPHPTISYSCPKRKVIVARMRKSKKHPSSSPGSVASFSESASSACSFNPWQSTSKVNWSSTQESIVLSAVCLLVSSAKEKESPGTFNDVLKSLQLVNNVPQFKFGEVTPPRLESYLQEDVIRTCFDRVELADPEIVPVSGSHKSPPDISSRPSTSTSLKKKTDTFPSICIVKRKTAPAVTSASLETMYREGLVRFENNDGLDQDKCLELLKGNMLERKIALSKIKVKDFRSKN